MAPWQVDFIAITTLFNLVRFVAPILFTMTRMGYIAIPYFDAAKEGWDWPVFVDFTCGSTCWIVSYYCWEDPTPKVWAMTVGWLFYSGEDMVNALQCSFVQ